MATGCWPSSPAPCIWLPRTSRSLTAVGRELRPAKIANLLAARQRYLALLGCERARIRRGGRRHVSLLGLRPVEDDDQGGQLAGRGSSHLRHGRIGRDLTKLGARGEAHQGRGHG